MAKLSREFYSRDTLTVAQELLGKILVHKTEGYTLLDKEDLLGDKLYLETGKEENFKIVKTKRIGIGYAKEAIHYPYRFYVENNPFVSKLNVNKM